MSNRSLASAASEHGRYAALKRSRADDDPELLEACRRIREECLVAAFKRVLDGSSAVVTAELRARIDTLLTDRQLAV